ncbi:16S rRNA m(7)g-527 methyltransferase [Sporocytophaga myxococcoides]|uniref:Ribosomal RNA small subunit methyltransferase G n=1 Tax=Sporocytophaga myxococcoides TaxID=153721 RepID=A0A098LAU2_9BACT|nr:16S rRNA (guanine(527)-N(7))-methyltransferase RsmG [Sporocytophaga myxococcoides]GAL84086.1 16S rRNA m(7)g-527 methyltransferase [Sporocytophaga myxococcoides]
MIWLKTEKTLSKPLDLIKKYFPELSSDQITKFEKLEDLYKEWNQKINVISRKDIDLLYERHILHSLAIAKVIQFKPQTTVLDIGTGGGFPGIPLAIYFPETDFLLVDSIGKKIKVVEEVSSGVGLHNLKARQARAEQIPEKFDFVVSRAVTTLDEIGKWAKGKYLKGGFNDLDNGLLYLKGGDLTEELKNIKSFRVRDISEFFEEEFFETKKVVYVPATGWK